MRIVAGRGLFTAGTSVCKPSFQFWFLCLFLMPAFPTQADTEKLKDFRPQAIIEKVVEGSKPLFDAEIFSRQPKVEDEFFEKLRHQQKSFLTKEQERKEKFFERLNKKSIDPEKRQRKIVKYSSQELKRKEKFIRKRQAKIEKYMGSRG